MNSVMSFPERGNYGNSNWRGNTSGYVIKELNKQLFLLEFDYEIEDEFFKGTK